MRSDARKRLADMTVHPDPAPDQEENNMSSRTSATPGALYSEPRVARKRRRCSGHLADPHWIEVGQMVVWSSLPPNHPDIGNEGWWHARFCLDCAPNVRPRAEASP